jgi:LysM repeat protein
MRCAAQQPSYQERVQRYIAQYKDLAMAEQRRSGIPASITLGQGIFETSAGASELATMANNHFGIKCKKEWRGETFAHTDDAPNECFRKYSRAEDSYKDHSDYLKNSPRYASCFQQSPNDYAAWAHHLKRNGYATNPKYAQLLIRLIEDFNLHQYTLAALEPQKGSGYVAEVIPEKDATPQAPVYQVIPAKYEYAATAPAADSPMTVTQAAPAAQAGPSQDADGTARMHGLKGFYARKGDVLLSEAIRRNIRYARLLEMNDLPDAPLDADQFIYTERKLTRGLRATHVVRQGETARSIAQAEGMQLRALRELNQLEPGEEPAPGTVLQLQQGVAYKPRTYRPEAAAAPIIASTAPAAAYVNTTASTAVSPVPAVPEKAPESAKPAEAAAPVVSQAAAPAKAPATETVTASTEPVAPVRPAVNIADEKAVEEEEPAEAVNAPQSSLDRLKAKFDKAVYAPAKTTPVAETPKTSPVVPAAAAPEQAPAFHVVQKGETAFSIAQRYNITITQLREWNGLDFKSGIRLGQKLKVR